MIVLIALASSPWLGRLRLVSPVFVSFLFAAVVTTACCVREGLRSLVLGHRDWGFFLAISFGKVRHLWANYGHIRAKLGKVRHIWAKYGHVRAKCWFGLFQLSKSVPDRVTDVSGRDRRGWSDFRLPGPSSLPVTIASTSPSVNKTSLLPNWQITEFAGPVEDRQLHVIGQDDGAGVELGRNPMQHVQVKLLPSVEEQHIYCVAVSGRVRNALPGRMSTAPESPASARYWTALATLPYSSSELIAAPPPLSRRAAAK